jgi:hypothetical protein
VPHESGDWLSSLRDLQGVTRQGLEAADILIDLRSDVETSILNQVRRSAGGQAITGQLVGKAVELTALAFSRQHALERDLLARLGQFIVEVQGGPTPRKAPAERASDDGASEPPYAAGDTVHVTTRVGDGPLVVPLKLRNHHDSPQTITLRAANTAQAEGAALPADLIHFHPGAFTLPAREAMTACVVIEVDERLRPPDRYWTEIRIGGSDPRRFPLCLTLLPAEPPAADLTRGEATAQ